jgi:hypothetical protein
MFRAGGRITKYNMDESDDEEGVPETGRKGVAAAIFAGTALDDPDPPIRFDHVNRQPTEKMPRHPNDLWVRLTIAYALACNAVGRSCVQQPSSPPWWLM